MPKPLAIYKRVVELDMLYPYLVYFIALSLGTMYVFCFIISFVSVLVSILLTVAHMKNNRTLRLIGKAANVVLTCATFINIFASDMFIDP